MKALNKLGISITDSHIDNPSIDEQIKIFAAVGFDSFFLSCGVTDSFEKIPMWAALAKECGIEFEAVHAPSDNVNFMWCEDDKALGYIERARFIVNMCSDAQVDKLIVHTAYGNAPKVSEIGLNRFHELEKYAQSKGVHICYENADVAENLLATVKNCDVYHGFCFDSGHNFCYAPDIQLLKLLGKKLHYTHLHDNFGKDDLHLLPFDGALDWQKTARALAAAEYQGTLNLELSCRGKTEYNKMSYTEFIKAAYKRACKLRELMK